MSSALLAFAGSTGALAQDSATVDLEEIVVTGTLIRGQEATGSEVIGIDSVDIAEVGATTTYEILGTLPQIGNMFNGRFEGDPRGAFQDSINRPNLRDLPSYNAASGAVTLILVDGMRIAPMGVEEAAIDPDVIPSAILERIEVVPDGGSSLYGADAVGGVINFRTKREFEGVQVDLSYAAGDTISSYDTWDGTFTAGTSFENGNAYISIGHYDRTGVTNGEVDWARQGIWEDQNTLLGGDTQCLDPVGTVNNWFWYGAGWTDNPAAPGAGPAAVGEACSQYNDASLIAHQERDSLFGSLNYDFSDSVNLRVTAYYTDRETNFDSYPRGFTTPGSDASPTAPGDFIGQIIGIPQGVAFSFGAHPAYVNETLGIEMSTWGISNELTMDLTDNWRFVGNFYYGESEASSVNPAVNNTLATEAFLDGQFDPFNIAAADAGLIRDITDWAIQGETEQDRLIVRGVVDGSLFELPAGNVGLAVGLEYTDDGAKTRQGSGRFGSISSTSFTSGSRDTTSAFAEVQVPVFSMLDFAFSVRYDDYSDFGETTNPSVGFTFTPTDWLSVKGKWGESFNAPTVLDGFGIATARWIPNAANPAVDVYGDWNGSGSAVVHATGSDPSIGPQTAENTAFTVELNPTDSLVMTMTYYTIEFEGLLGAVNPQNIATRFAFPEKYIWSPTEAEYNAFLARLANASDFDQFTYEDVGYLLDRITSNLSDAELEGFDFAIGFAHDTDVGSFQYSLAGNHITKMDIISGSVQDGLEFDISDTKLTGTVGWSGENLNAKVTVKYSNGYDVLAQFGQTSVPEFVTADLFVGYRFADGVSGLTDGLSLRFNIDNLFEEDPAVVYRNQSSLAYANWTLGRVYKLGISKSF